MDINQCCVLKKNHISFATVLEQISNDFFGFFVCLFAFVLFFFFNLKTTSNLSKLETLAVAFAHFVYILGLLDLG